MNAEFCSPQSGLRAYYKFNQGKAGGTNSTVKSLTDYSGYNNTGVVANFSLTGSTSNWVVGKTLTKGNIRDTTKENRCDRFRSPSGKYTWSKPGVYKDTLPSYFGCDSALTIYLTLRYKTTKNISAWACNSYTSPSGTYTWTKSGNYTDYLLNSVGCDSVINIALSIGGTSANISADVCNTYTSPLGKVYTETGVYTDTTKNYRGCDSFIVIDLKVRKTTFSSMEKKFCTPFRVPSRKYYIKSPGTYFDTLINAAGCDSIITVKAITLATEASIKATVCDSYKSPSERYLWTKTGIYKDTVLNSNFCDSIVTVDLTVLGKTYYTLNESACKFYTLPSKKNSYTKSTVIMDTIKNSMGCDSVITINLTILKVGVGVTVVGDVLTCTNTSASAWQWVLCNQNYKEVADATTRIYNAKTNGNYAVVVTEGNCKDTSECFWITSANTQELRTGATSMDLIPNPLDEASSELKIQYSNYLTDGHVRIINLQGEIVLERKFSGDSVVISGLSEIRSGLYLVKTQNNGWQESKFLMKR